MDYKKLYQEIILKAKSENRKKGCGVYYEQHHIVPDFMFKHRKRNGPAGHLDGDPNCQSNLVLLTFQEHLLAHYYLFETLKGTHYEYPAGTALQFFFVKATGNHKRQISLTEVDEIFLQKMAHLRALGISAISNARKGKMPVVDAVTREKIGSVPVDHPNVLLGKWVHHSKGRPGKGGRNQKGSNNGNYKEMTAERKLRVFKCVSNSILSDGYIHCGRFIQNLKNEFVEFKKISEVWIRNHIGSTQDLLDVYNKETGAAIKYSRYHRSPEQILLLKQTVNVSCIVTNGISNKQINKNELEQFLSENPEFSIGKTK